jgi:hypothetical protein
VLGMMVCLPLEEDRESPSLLGSALQIHFQVMVYTCTESEQDCVSHVPRVSRVLSKTGDEQKLGVWSWLDACVIA